ncbi:MAG: sodium:calcium antiporter [Candidatus Bathyarchaeota archaeon]|nr:sodium:calcium antiporter [Candidatus Bathyarchaeota archaeon]
MADLFSIDFLINIVIIAVAIVVLNLTSDVVIKYATKIAAITRLGKTSVGFTLISLSTTLPELTVALSAALSGGAALSIGNAIGSNVFNISAILGIGAVILGLNVFLNGKRKKPNHVDSTNIIPNFESSELSNIEFGLFVASVVPLALLYVSPQAAWFVGLILLGVFVVYLYRLTKVRITTEPSDAEVTAQERGKLKQFILFTVLGALGVVISANFMVDSAISIATAVGVPQQVIGATIVALGTSLPELTIGVKSILRGHPNLTLGNIIGAAFFNTTLILGVTLFVPTLIGSTLMLDMQVYLNLIVFSIIINTFFWFFLSRKKITWKEGTVLLIIYALFIITTLTTGLGL